MFQKWENSNSEYSNCYNSQTNVREIQKKIFENFLKIEPKKILFFLMKFKKKILDKNTF